MPKGCKRGGRDFKPGQSGNPNGRPPIPQEIKEARKLTMEQFESLVYKYLEYNPQELATALTNKDSKLLDLILLKIMSKAVNEGDQKRLDFILDRLFGKAKQSVSLESKEGLTFVVKDFTSKK